MRKMVRESILKVLGFHLMTVEDWEEPIEHPESKTEKPRKLQELFPAPKNPSTDQED